jgi:aconitate hydratase
MVPFTAAKGDEEKLAIGDWVYVPRLRKGLLEGGETFEAFILKGDGRVIPLALGAGPLSKTEREILLAGGLINFYAATA